MIGLCFWFICILVIKNQSVWMLTCTEYQVFVSLCFKARWYNFYKSCCSWIPPSSAWNCYMIKISQLFHILNFFQNWILIWCHPNGDGIILLFAYSQNRRNPTWCGFIKVYCQSMLVHLITRHWLHLVFYRWKVCKPHVCFMEVHNYLWLSNWNCQYGQLSWIPDIQGSQFFRPQRTFVVNEKN